MVPRKTRPLLMAAYIPASIWRPMIPRDYSPFSVRNPRTAHPRRAPEPPVRRLTDWGDAEEGAKVRACSRDHAAQPGLADRRVGALRAPTRGRSPSRSAGGLPGVPRAAHGRSKGEE